MRGGRGDDAASLIGAGEEREEIEIMLREEEDELTIELRQEEAWEKEVEIEVDQEERELRKFLREGSRPLDKGDDYESSTRPCKGEVRVIPVELSAFISVALDILSMLGIFVISDKVHVAIGGWRHSGIVAREGASARRHTYRLDQDLDLWTPGPLQMVLKGLTE